MRFIHKWSYCCANFLTNRLNESHQKRGVYYYGFQVIIGAIVKIIILVSLAILLRTLVPTLIVVFTFAILRTAAGGYHMDTYGKCIATSLVIFVLSGVIVQYTCDLWKPEYIIGFAILSFTFCILAAYKWAPSDTPNRPITKIEEIVKFKKRTYAYIVSLLFVIIVVILIRMKNFELYSLGIIFGMSFEMFTITPLGYKFFNKISKGFNSINSINTKA